jgi:hypothetical protein
MLIACRGRRALGRRRRSTSGCGSVAGSARPSWRQSNSKGVLKNSQRSSPDWLGALSNASVSAHAASRAAWAVDPPHESTCPAAWRTGLSRFRFDSDGHLMPRSQRMTRDVHAFPVHRAQSSADPPNGVPRARSDATNTARWRSAVGVIRACTKRHGYASTERWNRTDDDEVCRQARSQQPRVGSRTKGCRGRAAARGVLSVNVHYVGLEELLTESSHARTSGALRLGDRSRNGIPSRPFSGCHREGMRLPIPPAEEPVCRSTGTLASPCEIRGIPHPLVGGYRGSLVPIPAAFARATTTEATVMSSAAIPRLHAIVRSPSERRPGCFPETSSLRSTTSSGR